MTAPESKNQVEIDDPEIILCRGSSYCHAVDAWPCERCLRTNVSESWLIEELLDNLDRRLREVRSVISSRRA
jgi:hypothetical protein